MQVLRHTSSLRHLASFRPWFYRIVVNAAKRLARSASRRTVPLDLESHDQADATAAAPDELALSTEEVARLRVAIGELNKAHRVPVFLRYFSGLSEQEIAQALDLPPGTVKSRLHNARRMLQVRLEGAKKAPLLAGVEGVVER